MTRKPRKDSKLHALPPEHRVMVNRWLFDKGLSYQQVADACLQMFGLKITRSSVGRYFERETLSRIAQKKQAERRAQQQHEAAAFAALKPEEQYQKLLEIMAQKASDALNRLEDPLDWRTVCTFAKVLIAARRERSDAILAAVEREKFEFWAARKVLERHYAVFGARRVSPVAARKGAPLVNSARAS